MPKAKNAFAVGDEVKSVITRTHGKEGVVEAINGKNITVKWSRGPNTEETSRRLVHKADYEAKEPKSKKRKTVQKSAASDSAAAPKRARAAATAAPESESESESQFDSDQSDDERGEVRDRFTGKLHHDACGNCGEGGTLYECDWCDCAYHKECTMLPGGEEPPDDYKCYQCEAEEAQEAQYAALTIVRWHSYRECFLSFRSDAFDSLFFSSSAASTAATGPSVSAHPVDVLHPPPHFAVQVRGRTWRHITNLAFDQAATPVYTGDVFNWALSSPGIGQRSEFDYFKFM